MNILEHTSTRHQHQRQHQRQHSHHLSANLTTPSPGRSSIVAATTTPAMLACTRRSPSPALAGNPDTFTVVGRLSNEKATRGSPPPPPRPPPEEAGPPLPLPLHKQKQNQKNKSGSGHAHTPQVLRWVPKIACIISQSHTPYEYRFSILRVRCRQRAVYAGTKRVLGVGFEGVPQGRVYTRGVPNGKHNR